MEDNKPFKIKLGEITIASFVYDSKIKACELSWNEY